MKFILRHLKILLTLFSFLCALQCHSQTEHLFEENFSTENSFGPSLALQGIGSSKLFGDKFMFVSDHISEDRIWLYDLSESSHEKLLSSDFNVNNSVFDDSGLFYTTYHYDDFYYLHYIDTNGDQMDSVKVGFYESGNSSTYKLKNAQVFNGKYYFNSFYEDEYHIWESDGTNQGTQIIFSSIDPIEALFVFEENLHLVVHSVDYELHSFTDSEFALSQVISGSEINSSFDIIGNDGEFFYFNAQDSLDQVGLYRMSADTPPELFNNLKIHQIIFQDDTFRATGSLNVNFGFYLIEGQMSAPYNLDTLSFSSDFGNQLTYVSRILNNELFMSVSSYQGMELCQINENSTIELKETHVKGPGSSIPVNLDGYHFWEDYPAGFYLNEQDETYCILTNGNDDKFYLYGIGQNSELSFFEMENPFHSHLLFVHDSEMFWLELDDYSFSMKKRSLITSNQGQPLETSENDTWFRQLVLAYGEGWYNSSGIYLNLQQIQLDSNENVMLGLDAHSHIPQSRIYSSDTLAYFEVPGVNICAKYDKYGNFKWVNGIGYPNGFWLRDSRFHLKNNGNVLAIGIYFGTGYFDDDSLESERAGCYLAELDSETGEVLWKKTIAETYYADDIFLDGIITDAAGNIYVSFMYKSFYLNIEEVELYAPISPVNAIAKFNSEGELMWANTYETPWEDVYGRTTVLDFNEQSKTLLAAQSQGFYNRSSLCEYRDWSYFVQEINENGDVSDTFEFLGSDIGGVTAGAYSEDGLFLMGYHRGNLEVDHYSTESEIDGECHKHEGFSALLDNKISRVLNLSSTVDNKQFFPFDMVYNTGYFYVLGADENEELLLLKLTKQGLLVGHKKLGQFVQPFDFEYRNYLDVSDEHIVIAGVNFKRNVEMGVAPLVNLLPSASILKMENSDWESDLWLFENGIVDVEDGVELLIYPNPFSDFVNVVFSEENHGFDSYEIIDAQGKHVQNGILDEYTIQQISLFGLAEGVYILNAKSQDKIISRPLIKTK